MTKSNILLKDPNNGLTTIKENYGIHNDIDYYYSYGDVRDSFNRICENDSIIMVKVATDLIVESTLSNYMKITEYCPNPKYKKIPKELPPYLTQEWYKINDSKIYFNLDTLKAYLWAITELIGTSKCSYYQLVKNSQNIYHPIVFFITESKYLYFEEVINGLHNDKLMKIILKQRHPQYYQMVQIRILEELKINPLILISEKIKMETKELGKFIDFLSVITKINNRF